MRIAFENKEVCWAKDPVVRIGKAEVDFLKSKVHESQRQRFRVCAHSDTENKLHEMVVVYTKQTYIHPNKHINKEESLLVIEGLADFVLFNNTGQVIDVVHLGDYASGRQFYVRAPHSTYHSVFVRTDFLVVHETTEGPFRKESTVPAPWAPDEGDIRGIQEFREKSEAMLRRLKS